MTYRGHVQNGVVVLDPPANLPEGATVVVSVVVRRPPITSIEQLRSKLPDADKDFDPDFDETLQKWRSEPWRETEPLEGSGE
jgi:hypothetical protein